MAELKASVASASFNADETSGTEPWTRPNPAGKLNRTGAKVECCLPEKAMSPVSLIDFVEAAEQADATKPETWAETEFMDLKHHLDSLISQCQRALQALKNEEPKDVKDRKETKEGRRESAKPQSLPEEVDVTDLMLRRSLELALETQNKLYLVARLAPRFDLDSEIKGNGYRSVLTLIDCLFVAMSGKLGKYVKAKDDGKKVTRIVNMLEALNSLAGMAAEMASHTLRSGSNSLFADMPDDFMERLEGFSMKQFYGKWFGRHYPEALRDALWWFVVACASYSNAYNKHNNPYAKGISSVMRTTRFMRDENRSAILEKQFNSGDVNFAKSFWNLTESTFARHLPKIISPNLSVCRRLKIPVREIQVPGMDGSLITIRPPAGISHIVVRLLSYHPIKGLGKLKKSLGLTDVTEDSTDPNAPPQRPDGTDGAGGGQADDDDQKEGGFTATGLLVHFHGGGFIAQTSKSHEMYLKVWAKQLEVPILSVDYSLSPEAPFGVAVYECFYAYVWALANAASLKTTAQYTCFSGDSAGGNLSVAVTLKCIMEKVRLPSATHCSYPALCVQYVPSPARLLSLADAILPMGILKACLAAYAGKDANNEITDPLLSPWHGHEDLLKHMPPTYIVVGTLDPLLDDSVDFARKLRKAGVNVNLRLVDGAPHGFLQLLGAGDNVSKAYQWALDDLKTVLNAAARPPESLASNSGSLASVSRESLGSARKSSHFHSHGRRSTQGEATPRTAFLGDSLDTIAESGQPSKGIRKLLRSPIITRKEKTADTHAALDLAEPVAPRPVKPKPNPVLQYVDPRLSKLTECVDIGVDKTLSPADYFTMAAVHHCLRHTLSLGKVRGCHGERMVADGIPVYVAYPTNMPVTDRGSVGVVVFVHGGRMECRAGDRSVAYVKSLARDLGKVVVAPHYGSTVELSYPASVNDVVTAVRWVAQTMLPKSIVMGGEAEGATLAIAAALRLLTETGPGHEHVPLGGLFLTSPYLAPTSEGLPSRSQYDGVVLSSTCIEKLRDMYTPYTNQYADPYAWPYVADASLLRKLPPMMMVVAECDPLADEGKKFHQRLMASGVQASCFVMAGMVHGTLALGALVPDVVRSANAAIRVWAEDLLGLHGDTAYE